MADSRVFKEKHHWNSITAESFQNRVTDVLTSDVKQRVGPIPYALYTLFLNYLLNRKVPSEQTLKDAGMTTAATDLELCSDILPSRPASTSVTKQSESVIHTSNYQTFFEGTVKRPSNLCNKICSVSHFLSESDEKIRDATCPKDKLKEEDQIQTENEGAGEEINGGSRPFLFGADLDSAQIRECYDAEDELADCETPEYDDGDDNDDEAFQIVGYADEGANLSNPFINIASPLDLVDVKSPSSFAATTNNDEYQYVLSHTTEEFSATSETETNPVSLLGNSRKQKFLSWAKKMYVKVNLSPNGKEFEIVSLMSKKSNKEIAPLESFEQIVLALHSRDGKPGRLHLPFHGTVTELKKAYTFGRRDFGISGEFIRRSIAKCDALNCNSRILLSKTPDQQMISLGDESIRGKAKSLSRSITMTDAEAVMPVFLENKFYQDVAQVIVADEKQLCREVNTIEDGQIKKEVAAIKRAGNPQYYARNLKRKCEQEKNGQSPSTPKPAIVNPLEGMSLEHTYHCLSSLTYQMRRELLVMFAGERRHHDSLNRSIVAAQALVRRCQTLNNSLPVNDK